ncbi:hypothetical protein DNFV4_02908 [Nitrospira tepida]|uniref:ABC-type transport auxiliary lipoprotein component domain-containing protein n=1 Tax=Nitrospira tepida TaxID=2973512 RepID=A0AA86T8Y6_9BACT|nr:hypothetical protein [Nitrospira tepida]CAI4032478.1 hypothetical protein DNFV4_02908 [Nitrospira tepida]
MAYGQRGECLVLIASAIGLALLPACIASGPGPPPPLAVEASHNPTQIPASVERLAIIYPRSADPTLAAIYAHLEARTFLLKLSRPSLQIIDRTHLTSVLEEQRFQVSGLVSDDSMARIGHLLGADSILSYRVERPTLHDQFRARFSGQVPPVRVFSKVTLVESGEVVFHHVVTVQPPTPSEEAPFTDAEPLVQEAVKTGVGQTLLALQRAFQ